MRSGITRRAFLAGTVLCGIVALNACSFSTAHISEMRLSKEKNATTAVTSFGVHDAIHGFGEVSNVPGKVTVKWSMFVEKVEGQTDNSPIPSLDKSFDLPGSGTSNYDLTPGPDGWPPGKYRIEFSMVDENDKKDQKAVSFDITGG
jgi:hypothetical protein